MYHTTLKNSGGMKYAHNPHLSMLFPKLVCMKLSIYNTAIANTEHKPTSTFNSYHV